ncbi:uncharacterized protein B0P05DRAFT_589226 [Gilbertella persicaria]|uniref:uncharacterized protein n=1 Tax=Gilbertella persicaria TaxID=101096 RepID=UPI00221E80A5|nr:uncharacterized protein B0P05DRAFT_589226 [Gilbertella persicaria]KAI8069769.1 hypothetical protein B0P05DRAFT_589226 [Gilbertella persicaria]
MTLLEDPCQNSVIARAITQNSYEIENNALFYVLLSLFNIGMNEHQLEKVYQCMTKKKKPLVMPKLSKLQSPMHSHMWQDYLGDTDMYFTYLEFFCHQIHCYGIKSVMDQYYYYGPLSQSIGSPLIHLAMGIQHHQSQVVAQGLAHLASTFQNASFIVNSSSGCFTAHQILVDQIRVDPRFSLQSKQLLKNAQELLKDYVSLWKMPPDGLNELRLLTVQMMVALEEMSLLLNTINALNILYPNNSCPEHMVRIQLLNLMCYYIHQGRPLIPIMER